MVLQRFKTVKTELYRVARERLAPKIGPPLDELSR